MRPPLTRSALVRLGAVTHSVNFEQRYVPLSFTRAGARCHDRAAERQRGAAGLLHAVHRRLGRRSLGGEDGAGQRRRPAPAAAAASAPTTGRRPSRSRRRTGELQRAGDREPRGDGRTPTATCQGPVVQRSGEARRGQDAPYSSIERSGAGTYTLTAKAIDNVARTTTSTVSTIKVSARLLRIRRRRSRSPAGERREVHGAGNVSLAATASDPDGAVAKVEFFKGTTKLGEDTTAPYPRMERSRRRAPTS